MLLLPRPFEVPAYLDTFTKSTGMKLSRYESLQQRFFHLCSQTVQSSILLKQLKQINLQMISETILCKTTYPV